MRTAILWAMVVCAGGASGQTVGQWGRFEFSVGNRKLYADPYRAVSLNVRFTAPDGHLTDFWGFYDGDSRWKARFMPSQTGTWRYETVFSDGTPGVKGSFRCVDSTSPGMLSVDEENPLWFGFKGGRHLLVRSLHTGDRFFAANWPEAKRKAFLDWAQAQGYNTLSIASHYLNRDAEGRGRGWETPKLWPLDAGEYRKMERILDDLVARRILVFPFAGFFGQKSNYPRDPADQELYVRYSLARLGAYWNILLNVAGPEPNLKTPWMLQDEVERLGRLIRRLDVFGHPLSVHNRTGDDPYRDSDWTSYGTLQGPKTVERRKLSKGLLASHHPAKPLYAQETLWAGNKFHKEAYGEANLRKNAYVILMSAAALNFGDMAGDSSSGFSGTLELNERVQERHDIMKSVWDFFDSVPFWKMKPRPDLVDNGYCLAEQGAHYLVYLDSPGMVNVAVSGGAYRVRWINAQRTAEVRDGGETRDGKNLRTPDGGDDWLLELRRSGVDAR